MTPAHVLVTGATGFLGREVVARIVERMRPGRVSLLVRPRGGATARVRFDQLRADLRARGPGLDFGMVEPVRSDLEQPGLGLNPSEGAELSRTVTHLVHCAATVQLSASLRDACRTNLRGTESVLEFANRCDGLQRLVHVSTAFVAGDRSGRVLEDELECGQGFLNHYEFSKFEAERLVRRRMSALPIAVVRPSIVVGDSRDGHAHRCTVIDPVLRNVASGRLRSFRDSGAVRLDIVPVDYAADGIVRVLQAPHCEGRTFHLTAGSERALSFQRLCEISIAAANGRREPPLCFGDGSREVRQDRPRSSERLRTYLDYLASEKIFDDSHYRGLAGPERPCPAPESYLPRVLAKTLRRRARSGRRISSAALVATAGGSRAR